MAMHELNLLIGSAGRRVELLQLFRKSAISLDINLRIFVTDSATQHNVPAAPFADHFSRVPSVGDPKYQDAVGFIVEENRIDLVVPTIDPDLENMTELQQKMDGTSSCKFIVSSPETIAVCRDKLKTMKIFSEAGVPVPRSIRADQFDLSDEQWDWPIIVKPRGGSSSIGVSEHSHADENLRANLNRENIVQEKISGDEYTINSFVTDQGVILYTIPHLRLATRSGEVSKGVTVSVDGVDRLSEKIVRALPGLSGPFCYQAIKDSSGNLQIFEINGRFGGGYPLADRAGANGVEAILKQAIGMDVHPVKGWQEGLHMLRYDQSVFTIKPES